MSAVYQLSLILSDLQVFALIFFDVFFINADSHTVGLYIKNGWIASVLILTHFQTCGFVNRTLKSLSKIWDLTVKTAIT